MKQIKAVIFDVDGTLLDSMKIWENLAERYLSSQGIKAEPGLQERLEKMSTKQGVDYLIRHYRLPLNLQQGLAGVNALLYQFYHAEVTLKDGVRECLELLNTYHVPMIAATSGERKSVEAAMDRLKIRSYFQEILTCSEMDTQKTEPKIYLHAAHQMQALPQHTLVIEDVSYALETAKRAGFQTAGVYDKYNETQQESILKIADYYLYTLHEIETYIRGV